MAMLPVGDGGQVQRGAKPFAARGVQSPPCAVHARQNSGRLAGCTGRTVAAGWVHGRMLYSNSGG